MRYSIILPCYNVTKYLSACMDSLFQNDLSESEIILVNDGSKDDFFGWCREYFGKEPESKISVTAFSFRNTYVKIISQLNNGVSSARNAGMDHAEGAYLLFVDPDDEVTADYISTISLELSENKVDFLLFGFREIWIDDEGSVFHSEKLPLREYNLQNPEAVLTELLPNYLGKSLQSIDNWIKTGVFNPYQEWGSVWRCVFRRDVIMDHNIRFRENIVLNEDGIFNAEYICCINSAKACMKSLYRYIVRNSGALRQKRGNALLENKLALLEAREQICKRINAFGYEKASYLWYAGSCVFSIFQIMTSSDFSNWKEIKQYIKHPIVQKSIKCVPISIRKPAYSILVILLKMKLYSLLLVCFRICRRLNISYRL